MSVTTMFQDHVQKTKSFVDRVKDVYSRAYDKALQTGKGGLAGATRISAALEPKVRQSIDSAHHFFDGINQSLADKAIPECRRSNVESARLEEKSCAARHGISDTGASRQDI
ncbi:hypothetical protein [Hahella sp. HN01]|uniref:hypothetical protein n=1 Tax=Hahella sp. HN01 TaxID=2847262 RepID=UPI001C1F0984|nr:hypothetical protein [Hahella sp. HN01]MBU6952177.1 hypothetical protein [Hahella sp. HN01]